VPSIALQTLMSALKRWTTALRSATTLLAAMSAPVRMDTDWAQITIPAMVRHKA